MIIMAIYHHIQTLLFLVLAFVSGSLLTYVFVLTPRLSAKSSSNDIRGLDMSSTSNNNSLIRYIWGDGDRTLTSYATMSTHTERKEDENPEDHYMTRVRVLCWIMTSPRTLMKRAQHVRNTWGSRCDRTLYMSSQENETFPAVGLNVSEGRNALWSKTVAAFKYIYDQKYTDAYDWFLKADDDTYVIVENLKYFLRDKNASDPVYFGHHFKPYVRNGYMSGGAGYLLSKLAVKKFVEVGVNKRVCPMHFSAEDVAMGMCLQRVGIVAADSRDSLNRSRFVPFILAQRDKLPPWYFKFARHKLDKNMACCSDYLISCHYVRPFEMYVMDYYVYNLRAAEEHSDHTYLHNGTRIQI